MKSKKLLSLALALIMCLSLLPMTAFAADHYLSLDKSNYNAGETITVKTSNITAQMEQDEAFVSIYKAGAPHNEWGDYDHPKAGTDTLTFTAPLKNGSYEMRLYSADHLSDYAPAFVTSVPFTVGGSETTTPPVTTTQPEQDDTTKRYPTHDEFDWSLVTFTPGNHSWTGTYETNYETLSLIQKGKDVSGEYPEWENGKIDGVVTDGVLYGYWSESPSYAPPSDAGQIVFVMNEDGKGFTGWWRYGNSGSWELWSTSSRNEQDTSGWASEEIAMADALGLIPDSLKGQDLTKPITRAEFAAVSVKVYEALSGVKAIPAVNNPFTDTKDVEVLKAYNVGITAGTAADKFSPDVLLNREQAATMLTRVFKKVSMPGWTLSADGSFPLDYTKLAAFADDAKISDWAKPGVYFMVANGIISGVGNNTFAPKATTSEEEAKGYAQATREQALAIAVRMVEKLAS